ncbi:MAG: AraC family transcriptional regulator [Verrucomicrobiota bacterium]
MKAHLEQILAPQKQSFICRQFIEPSFDHPFHYHPEIELTYIVRSQGTRIIGDHVGSFNEGDLCLIGEYLPHVYRNTIVPEDQAISEVIHLPRDCANDFFDMAPELSTFSDLLDDARFGLQFDTNTSSLVRNLMIRLRETQGVQRWTLFFELIECLSNAPKPQTLASAGYTGKIKPTTSDRMYAVCQHILEHFDEDLSHEQLARMAHASPAHFSRLFKKTTRKTYQQFLSEVRLGHACRLLIESDLPIIEIAFASGFRNLSNFNRRFQHAYECSPREYRKRVI